MSLVQSKPTRNADHRHAQSLGRQRKNTTTTPREQAEAIAKVIRCRMTDGQALPNLNAFNLADEAWSELLSILTTDEAAEVNIACAGAICNAYDPTEQPPAVAPQQAPSWQGAFPVHTHSLSWTDSDGISHSHTVRSDDVDNVLRQVKTIKVVIAAAKTKAQAQAVDTKEPGSVSPRWCAIHDAEMTRRTSKKTGKLYSAHDTAEGLCFGRKAS